MLVSARLLNETAADHGPCQARPHALSGAWLRGTLTPGRAALCEFNLSNEYSFFRSKEVTFQIRVHDDIETVKRWRGLVKAFREAACSRDRSARDAATYECQTRVARRPARARPTPLTLLASPRVAPGWPARQTPRAVAWPPPCPPSQRPDSLDPLNFGCCTPMDDGTCVASGAARAGAALAVLVAAWLA